MEVQLFVDKNKLPEVGKTIKVGVQHQRHKILSILSLTNWSDVPASERHKILATREVAVHFAYCDIEWIIENCKFCRLSVE
jgi:hypothetical protein